MAQLDRRRFVAGLAASTLLLTSNTPLRTRKTLLRPIPSSGENIPVIGMGSWRTFDIGDDQSALETRADILRLFFDCGGRVVDSSPMYGSSQTVIGNAVQKLDNADGLFSADKVWTSGLTEGQRQIEESRSRWNLPKFDLLQVHNLVDWRVQLKTLFAMKEAGNLRYVGVTSYDGINYDLLEQIMKNEPIDFVQFSYNIADRRAEDRLLPLASDRNIGVIVNRPFQEGRLLDSVRGRVLPDLANKIGSKNWAQYLLQYIVSHPAVTVTIPATSRVDHMRENIAVLHKPVPHSRLREKMANDFAS
ncbi:aldo/keto reductase [Sphingorhabdus sp. EL138]|uniref:aldo/keto reductase n=1 Tax=Sphingorhabdus sp. EL138 TaxID=2073156 RepID=UPI000D695B70|nr:aldo/keto reductase [Sphingorhabdus sp. EL138]